MQFERVTRVHNGRKRRRVKKVSGSHKRRTRKANPGHLVVLGAVNPHGGSMAKRKRGRRATKRTSNPYGRKTRRRSFGRRRNPAFGGMQLSVKTGAMAVAGGLVGVTVTRTVVGMLPVTFQTGFLRVVSSIAVAIGSGFIANKVSPSLGSAVTFGGLMQAGSDLLTVSGLQLGIGLRGMGAVTPAQFTIPENPFANAMNGRRALAAASVKGGAMSGAFGPAFGRA